MIPDSCQLDENEVKKFGSKKYEQGKKSSNLKLIA